MTINKKLSTFSMAIVLCALAAMVACGSNGNPTDDLTDVSTVDQGGGDTAEPIDAVEPDVVADVRPDADDAAVDDVIADVADASADASDVAVPDAVDVTEDVPVIPDPALRLRANGWLSGDLHMHSTYSDGEDSVGTVVALAEYFQDPAFLAFHPEYVGNQMDFMALTDHRTADQNNDPEFVSDTVVLIPGEEFGGPGHANLFGVTTTVDHNPDGGAITLQNYWDGFEAAGAQGAVRSINHPYTTGILFPWDIHNYDAMEIWNVRWAVSQPGSNKDDIDAWAVAKGVSPSLIYRKGAQYQGIGGNAQSLKFYEALLSRGYHIALVGGSDRHTVFDIGFPATWVRSDDRTVDGVKDGIRARHTFVARTPVSATIEMSMTIGGVDYRMGDQIPVGAEGEQVQIGLRVTRADGGRVFLIGGHRIESDEALEAAELGVNVVDTVVDGNDFETQLTTTVHPGDWFYPVVWEPLVPEGLDPELAAGIPDIAANVALVRDGDYSLLIAAMVPYVDDLTFMTPEYCDPAGWDADITQCIPADKNGMATIFTPDWIDRVLNVVVQDGASSTEWTMGGVGSAILFVDGAPVL